MGEEMGEVQAEERREHRRRLATDVLSAVRPSVRDAELDEGGEDEAPPLGCTLVPSTSVSSKRMSPRAVLSAVTSFITDTLCAI